VSPSRDAGLAAAASRPFRLDSPADFVAAYTARMHPLRVRHSSAYWEFSRSGSQEAHEEVRRLEEEISDLHASRATWEALGRWHAAPSGDSLLDRQIFLLFNDFRAAQVDEPLRKRIIALALEVEEAFTVFRPEIDGRKHDSNELDRILLAEGDERRRRAAWEATRAIGGVVRERFVELARLRNEQARQLGFDDYFAFAMDDEEMAPQTLMPILDDLQARTEGPWRRCKAALDAEFGTLRGRAPGTPMPPWDFPDRFLQSVPRSDPATSMDAWFRPSRIQRFAQSFFASLGLPIERLWAASDMFPRDGKYPHAFCIGIDNPRDVRVLCNLDANARWMETTLHEFGHAVYNAGIAADLPWVLREPAHTFITEAVAMWFGRQAKEPRWLADVAKVPEDRARRGRAAAAEAQLVFARWGLLVTRFEQAMYAEPEQDLSALWWRLCGDLQGLERPADWDGADWAAKIHVACYPAYYHNYLLGEMLASQFTATIAARALKGRAVGHFFADLFRLGQSLRWDETVRVHTGAPLSAEHWVREFGSGAADG
jgi:peptidyl-dipeptidase A